MSSTNAIPLSRFGLAMTAVVISMTALAGAWTHAGQGILESSIILGVHIGKLPGGSASKPRVLLGPRPELVVDISLTNFEGARVWSVNALEQTIRVSIAGGGQAIPTTIDFAWGRMPGGTSLELHDDMNAEVTVRRVDGRPFAPGPYTVSVSLTRFFERLTFDDGSKWKGRADQEYVGSVVLADIRSDADRAAYNETEGQWRLWKGENLEAIPYLQEVARLRPGHWHAHVSLGGAYYRAGRFAQAVESFERGFSGWLSFSERRGEVAYGLATSYLALGRDEEARTVLKRMSLSDAEIAGRLEQMRKALKARNVPR